MPRLILAAALIALISACSKDADGPPIGRAVAYEVVRVAADDILGRTRARVWVYAPVTEYGARAETALKAAIDIQAERDVDFVEAFLMIGNVPAIAGSGHHVGYARFAPDGGGFAGTKPFRNGTWEASASRESIPAMTLRIVELWYANKERFRRIRGVIVDEAALRAFIAGELGIPVAQVVMPVPALEPYEAE